MSSFWPSGIDLQDTQSPRDILYNARSDWLENSGGVMELVFQEAKSKSGYPMIIVHAKHLPSERTSALFSIVYRANNPYPVMIETEDELIPQFLRKSYKIDTRISFPATDLIGQIKEVSNPWVSDTPAEFRKKLAEAFNLGAVKNRILNIVSGSPNPSEHNHEQPEEDSSFEQ